MRGSRRFIDEMRMRTVVSSSIYSSPWAEVNLDNPALLVSVLLMRWSVEEKRNGEGKEGKYSEKEKVMTDKWTNIDEMRMRTVVSSSIYSSPWAEVNLDNPALLVSVLLMRWSVWIVLKWFVRRLVSTLLS